MLCWIAAVYCRLSPESHPRPPDPTKDPIRYKTVTGQTEDSFIGTPKRIMEQIVVGDFFQGGLALFRHLEKAIYV